MKPILLPVLILGLTLSAAPGLAPDATASATPMATAVAPPVAPTHTLSISGTEVAMYPTFSPSIGRYAVTTGAGTGGTVTVAATTSDPAGRILVNGRLAPTGVLTLTDLEPNDEIAIFIEDSSGTARHSLIYLPEGFPTLTRDTSGPSLDTPSPGLVMLTLGLWSVPSDFFETAVDANGVPAMAVAQPNALDLKRLANGHYTVARGTGNATNAKIVELDEQFREIRSFQTKGIVNTDSHDSILLPDGSIYLMAYEPNPDTGLTDAIIQEQDPAGDVVFTWNSKDHTDPIAESVVDAGRAADGKDPDYAHINSMQIMADGDLLVSFRHFSSVFKIARTAHDGFAVGDVVWRLGGRDSDFTFTDMDGATDGGPCAQHTATQLPNGNILTFDNGAWSLKALCIDPSDPQGPAVARTPTRMAEWSLDDMTGTATLVRDLKVNNRYSFFAGSAQRLTDGSGAGNTVIGWASSTDAVASEVNQDGELLWDLKAVDSPKYFTYRAFKTPVPDAQPPVVTVDSPADGTVFVQGQHVTASFGCTDRGGSSLQTCSSNLSTATPGRHTFRVTATDGAGNITRSTPRSYTVLASYRPDAMIRSSTQSSFRGSGYYGPASKQQVGANLGHTGSRTVAVIRLTNRGARADRFMITWTRGSRAFGASLVGAARRSPVLQPGTSWTFRLEVTRRAAARPGNAKVFRVTAKSSRQTALKDAVALRARATR